MAKQNKSNLKLKAIAILDGVLTVAILVQISYCALYPLVVVEVTENPLQVIFTEFEKEMQKLQQMSPPFGIRSRRIGDEHNMGMPPIFRLLGMPPPKTTTTISTSFWVWSYVALHAFGVIPIVGAILLLWSTKQNVSHEQSLELINYWINCSHFTTFLAGVELFVMIVWLRELPEWIPIPTLIYLLLRVFATFTVRNTMDTLSFTMIFTPDVNSCTEQMKVRSGNDANNM